MLKDESFENRLNAKKEGKNIPNPKDAIITVSESEIQEINQKNNKETNKIEVPNNLQLVISIWTSIWPILNILLTSFLYGVGLNAILNMNWNLLSCLGVGLIMNHGIKMIQSLIYKIPSKLYNKKSV